MASNVLMVVRCISVSIRYGIKCDEGCQMADAVCQYQDQLCSLVCQGQEVEDTVRGASQSKHHSYSILKCLQQATDNDPVSTIRITHSSMYITVI